MIGEDDAGLGEGGPWPVLRDTDCTVLVKKHPAHKLAKLYVCQVLGTVRNQEHTFANLSPNTLYHTAPCTSTHDLSCDKIISTPYVIVNNLKQSNNNIISSPVSWMCYGSSIQLNLSNSY